MSDLLLESGSARRIVRTLGLPIPLPEKLRRAKGPWRERPLEDQRVVVHRAPAGELLERVAASLGPAGADAIVVGGLDDLVPFREPGEAFGRPARRMDPGEELDDEVDALVLDATGLGTPDSLRVLHDFFHGRVRKLRRCGRAVVLGRPAAEAESSTAAATQHALDGFVRSLAKEIGKRGATAQLMTVARGAEDRLAGVLRFVLSARSAFISGQPLRVGADARAAAATPWTRPLDGKVALVTGAARGIGKATAMRLAEEGAHVVCLDRPADDGPVSAVARQVGGTVLLADVSDPGAPGQIADALRERGLDVVVHNAGVTRDRTIAKMSAEDWDQALAINLRAVCDITEALLEGPLRDEGRIVCLSSVAGIAGNLGQTNYAASKSGLLGWVPHLARRVAARGITVNAVAPGFIETRLTAAIPPMIREAGRRLSNLGQGGQPEDVAELITFLSSPGSHGLTGGVVRVCGGALVGA